MQTNIITDDDLRRLYEAVKTKDISKLTPKQRLIYSFYLRSNAVSFTSKQIASKEEKAVNDMMQAHASMKCTLSEPKDCLIHRTSVFFCLSSHTINKIDPLLCPICSSFFTPEALKQQQRELIKSTELILHHFKECQGCWKCCRNSLHRMNPISPSVLLNPSMPRPDLRDDLKMDSADDCIPLPRGIFYTDEGRAESTHHGYLRIIPLSFENEVAECSDYQDLVKQLHETPSYMEQHVFECRQIEEGERRLRHVVEKEDVTRLLDRGVGVSDAVVEMLSLALKEYLSNVVAACKREHELRYGEEGTIDVADVEQAQKESPYL